MNDPFAPTAVRSAAADGTVAEAEAEAEAEVAQRLATAFLTPRRVAAQPEELALLARARHETLPASAAGPDAPALPCWVWEPGPHAAAAVLLVHGWDSRGSHLGAWVPPLLRAGVRVLAFDAPAHGDAPGRQ